MNKIYIENPFSAGKFELSGGDNLEEAAKDFQAMLDAANDKMASSINTTVEFLSWDEIDRAVLKMKHVYKVDVKEVY
ncbi:MAG: hypothetical protein II705_05810 [Clostridia bacterium]|jgi:hypothetical protein|nr:hypothetical protein [Clostridia bacterium]MBQ4249540.1 hypothetical protein [Clostridia bacterium]